VQTAIANESQGKNVQIALKEAEEADQIDARIVVTEAKPWNFAVSLSNTGSRATGRDRLTFSGSHANVFNLDHQFTGAYTTSIERPGDVRQFGAELPRAVLPPGRRNGRQLHPLHGGGGLWCLEEHRRRPDHGCQLQPLPGAGSVLGQRAGRPHRVGLQSRR
jgi:hypothetical protein